MQHAERAAALGPDQQHRVLSRGNAFQCTANISHVLDAVTIDFQDHIALGNACVVRRTARLDVADNRSVNVSRSLQLLAQFRTDIHQSQTPASLALLFAGSCFGALLVPGKLLQRYWKADVAA